MPRPILTEDRLELDKGVKCEVKSGKVTVQGSRGSLTKDLSHLKLDFEYNKDGHEIIARSWFGNKKLRARIGTLFGTIKNMSIGVTKGFRYKMRFVYSHFPIKHIIGKDGSSFSFNGFMGQREQKVVNCPKGVKISDSKAQKEEIIVEGNDLEAVSLVCGQIHQHTRIRNKDLRKFLDGIYVSETGTIDE